MSRVDDIIHDLKAVAFDQTIQEMAKACGMSHDAVSRLLSGRLPKQITKLRELEEYAAKHLASKVSTPAEIG